MPLDFDRAAQAFTGAELKEMTATAQARGIPPETFIEHRLRGREQQIQEQVGEISRDPDFQAALIARQLPEGATAEMREEALGPIAGFQMSATFPLGQGRATSPEGRRSDVQNVMGDDYEVKIVAIPNEQGEMVNVEMVREPGQEEFIPANRPGPSMADVYEIAGDLATFEAASQFVPLGKVTTLPLKAGARAVLGATGAAADVGVEALTESEAVRMEQFTNRTLAAGTISGVAELVLGGKMAGLNRLAGRTARTGRLSDKAIDRAQAYESLREGGRAFDPLVAGQISPKTWVAKLRARLGEYSPALREQILEQRLSLSKPLDQEMDNFIKLDGYDQAIVAAGYSPEALRALEDGMRKRLEDSVTAKLGVGADDLSKSGAGSAVQQALFDLKSGKISYRQVVQQRQRQLAQEMEDAAYVRGANAPNAMEFDIGDALITLEDFTPHTPIGVKKTMEGPLTNEIPTPLSGSGIPSASGREHMHIIQRELSDGLGYVQNVLESLDTSQLRSDRFITMNVPGTDGKLTSLNVNGFDVIRVLRGKLSQYFGNELMRGSPDAVIAKQLYKDLGNALEGATGPGAAKFVPKAIKYNRATTAMHNTLSHLEGVRLATMPDPQGLVDYFTSGQMGFKTAKTMGRALRIAGQRGAAARQKFKDSATRHYIQNPQDIKNLRKMDPKTANEFFSPVELDALNVYGSNMELLTSRRFSRTMSDAGSAQARGLNIFTRATDDEFQTVWAAATPTEKVTMRTGILNDLLQSSQGPALGVAGVASPRALANNLDTALNGPLAGRYRQVLPKETIEAMKDTEFASAFMADVGGGDFGATLAASEKVGQIMTAPTKPFNEALKIIGGARLLTMMANSLADGALARILRPAVKQPWNPSKTMAITRASISTINSLQDQADSDESLRRKEEALAFRQQEALRQVQGR